ncbi:universal stress protein [Paucilactobacillus suebicus]|uniref:Universal stress protein n=1 Tax=Paucilactobacillus suebicus DSM 5007 = KCTC 3549 TaxID=1423807 RepID=A0A0R1W673_9LACO|nr:universal stress protein [Paucilactobacillus suebicus]KRM13400.1 universal stress protein [Paucilactobacillus suebicus DSM 5007 = KCTC 3549]
MAIEITVPHFDKILVGVDDAVDAKMAFDYAVDKAKRDESELGIVSILETGDINVYQALSKDYVHGTRDELDARMNEYVEAAINYGVDPKKITKIIDEGSKPAERIINHVLPAYKPDLLVIGSIGSDDSRKLFGSQAAYMAKNAGISVTIIRK